MASAAGVILLLTHRPLVSSTFLPEKDKQSKIRIKRQIYSSQACLVTLKPHAQTQQELITHQ